MPFLSCRSCTVRYVQYIFPSCRPRRDSSRRWPKGAGFEASRLRGSKASRLQGFKASRQLDCSGHVPGASPRVPLESGGDLAAWFRLGISKNQEPVHRCHVGTNLETCVEQCRAHRILHHSLVCSSSPARLFPPSAALLRSSVPISHVSVMLLRGSPSSSVALRG